MFDWISNILKTAAAVTGWGQQRSADKNTAEMKTNKDAAVREDIRTAATDAVATGDDNAIKKQLADQ